MSKFFKYSQNNSGGRFDFDIKRGITHFVVIEADSVDQANEKAENIGLYFNGEGDCSCCGKRWGEAWDKGTDEPTVYGQTPEEYIQDSSSYLRMKRGHEIAVHYADGKVKWY